MELIHNYIDTFLGQWLEFVQTHFEGELKENEQKLEDALTSSEGSSNRSRAKEFYRAGFLTVELTNLRNRQRIWESDQNPQTKLGFLAAAIAKTQNQEGGPREETEQALDALAAIVILIQGIRVGNTTLSINYIIQRLLEAFPCPDGADNSIWLNQVYSGCLSEIECNDKGKIELLESFLLKQSHICPSLRIFELKDREISENVRCELKPGQKEFNEGLDLNNIPHQRAGRFLTDNNRKGFYFRASRSFPHFLQRCYSLESQNPSESPFKSLFDESPSGAKAMVLETLSEICSKDSEAKNEYFKIMKTILKGAQEAIDLLGGAGGAGQGAMRGMNVIYFGPPGTGKSTEILNAIPKIEPVGRAKTIRVTFHPDTDYASFVGCYKPRNSADKSQIIYEFAPQAFTKAYVEAWKNKDIPHVLVIEELNRGNCAQIFGDIFQLLDRDGNGESKFPITPDQDLKKYLAEQFKNVEGLPDEIKKGEEMKLPANLYVWATINTSDQSLFPIDSAFKRRWDWRYVPIRNEQKGFYVSIAGKCYDWWDFLEKINKKITSATSSEDKQIGYWFARPSNGDKEISTEDFTYKVLAYLWMDVFKDIDEGSPFFFDDKRHSYSDFSTDEGLPKEETLKDFLVALGVKGQDAPAPAGADVSTTAP